MDWSSAKVIKAVENQGYRRTEGRGKKGTHRVWVRKGKPGELHNTATIPVDRKRIAPGTMRSILGQLGIEEATLTAWYDKTIPPKPVAPPKVQPAYRRKKRAKP